METAIGPRYTPSEEQLSQVNKVFTFHPAQGDQASRYEAIRFKAKELALLMVSTCPPSRELSLALTHLQIAVMCANASIACNEPAIVINANEGQEVSAPLQPETTEQAG